MPMRRSLRIALHGVGAVFGVIAWAIVGIGLAELGVLSHFDPAGVLKEPPEQTIGVTIAEQSLALYVILSGWMMPSWVAWLLRPAHETPTP
jgi:hypothetical protein